jgi:hypothetical protein
MLDFDVIYDRYELILEHGSRGNEGGRNARSPFLLKGEHVGEICTEYTAS